VGAQAPVKAFAGFHFAFHPRHAPGAPAFKAVLYTRRRPVVADRYLAVVLDYHRADVAGQAV
jgi:hypothetical protein